MNQGKTRDLKTACDWEREIEKEVKEERKGD